MDVTALTSIMVLGLLPFKKHPLQSLSRPAMGVTYLHPRRGACVKILCDDNMLKSERTLYRLF